jgi:hypothetical protein
MVRIPASSFNSYPHKKRGTEKAPLEKRLVVGGGLLLVVDNCYQPFTTNHQLP